MSIIRKILIACFGLVASVAFATTTVPVQLLNPTGSTSGQAIVSSGASSAPAWGGVGLNGIAAIAANTVLANVTSSSASPTAFAMPSCNSSILQYTSGTGFTCSTSISGATTHLTNSSSGASILWLTGNGSTTPSKFLGVQSGLFTIQNSAQSANILTLTDSGNLSSAGSIAPSSTAGIVGTTAGDNANAGSVGEYQTNSTTGTPLTNGVNANATSISLTAGDWDVMGIAQFNPAASTVTAGITCGVSTTSATFANAASGIINYTLIFGISSNAGVNQNITCPMTRISVSSTTTVYLVVQAGFSTSTMSVNGFIRARRVR